MTLHADFATLVAEWLGELDEAREATLEEHYLGCGQCSAALAEVEALAEGVRRGVGQVDAVLTPAFAEQLRARGMRLREYRVPRNGSVNCTIAPEDQLLLSRLQVPLGGVDRIDLLVVTPAGQFRLEDVPFDAASGEVVLAPSLERVRAMPAQREVMRLIAIEAGGERLLGEYTFNHTPHRA